MPSPSRFTAARPATGRGDERGRRGGAVAGRGRAGAHRRRAQSGGRPAHRLGLLGDGRGAGRRGRRRGRAVPGTAKPSSDDRLPETAATPLVDRSQRRRLCRSLRGLAARFGVAGSARRGACDLPRPRRWRAPADRRCSPRVAPSPPPCARARTSQARGGRDGPSPRRRLARVAERSHRLLADALAQRRTPAGRGRSPPRRAPRAGDRSGDGCYIHRVREALWPNRRSRPEVHHVRCRP